MGSKAIDDVQFNKDTHTFSKTVESLESSIEAPLSDISISSLLILVKNIDQLLKKHDILVEQSGAPISKWTEPRKTSKNGQKLGAAGRAKPNKSTIEFDVLSHLPKNFYNALLPLNENGCPGLLETRNDFRVAQKKKQK